ncbi:MAG: hypothetical protein LAT80_09470 [Balneolaceae bacterium]|nr:hypothetical protein [Balneolaceae bacterium]
MNHPEINAEKNIYSLFQNKDYDTSSLRVNGSFRHSRNTIIVKLSYRGKSLIAKINHAKKVDEIEEEFQQINWLADHFKHDMIKVPQPFLLESSSKLIITEEASGISFSELIRIELNRNVPKSLIKYLELCAEGLEKFHSLTLDASDGSCKLYLDYSPANILVDKDSLIITLIDPPERNIRGDRFHDVGTFLFELGRTFLKSGKLLPIQTVDLDLMKKEFIDKYCSLSQLNVTDTVLNEIRFYEKKRAEEVLGFYKSFSSDKSHYEYLRGSILKPLIHYYSAILIPKSYKRIEKLISQSADS